VSLNHPRPTNCPECGTTEFEEIARVEADEIVTEDVAVYRCTDGHEFENRPPAAVFEVPAGQLGFIGSPNEFARWARETGKPLPPTASVSLGPHAELRMFQLPTGQTGQGIKGKVPGYNIRIVRPGAILATTEGESDGLAGR
jgi:hypothetical protein